MAKVALCIIATNGYIDFVEDLVDSAFEYFLNGHDVHFHIFTNHELDSIGYFHHHKIQHEPWPAMTLKRYHIMSSVDLSGYDYIFYVDADSLFVAPVGDEIFAPLFGVRHPGYAISGKGDWETREQSNAFVMPCKRKVYLAGGFQGGAKYWQACKYLAERIKEDTANGITAKWHDESHWNKGYTLWKSMFKVAGPDYCMVEEPEKRKLWGIYHLQPKIIALSKYHKKYQK